MFCLLFATMPPFLIANIKNEDNRNTVIEVSITCDNVKHMFNIFMSHDSTQVRETFFSSGKHGDFSNVNNSDLEEILECIDEDLGSTDYHEFTIAGLYIYIDKDHVTFNECQYMRTPEINTLATTLITTIKNEQNKLVNFNMINKLKKYQENAVTNDDELSKFKLFNDNCTEASYEFKQMFDSTK